MSYTRYCIWDVNFSEFFATIKRRGTYACNSIWQDDLFDFTVAECVCCNVGNPFTNLHF